MNTQDNALTAGAELILAEATAVGVKCGLPASVAGVTVLERALAIGWVNIIQWGGNDNDASHAEAVRLMRNRITTEITAQRILRTGQLPT